MSTRNRQKFAWIAVLLVLSGGTSAGQNITCMGQDRDVKSRIANVRPGVGKAGGKTNQLDTVYCDASESCVLINGLFREGTRGVEFARTETSVCIGVPGDGTFRTASGWEATVNWQATDEPMPSTLQWVGVWQDGPARITVQRSPISGQLHIEGHAAWPKRPTEDFGEFRIAGIPTNGIVTTDQTVPSNECHVAMRLVGEFLVAADDSHCGGLDVSFEGVYRLLHR